MPTTFTRRAGLAAIACPLAILAGMLLGGVEQWTSSTWTPNWYFAGNSAVLLGLALLVVALLGFRARYGGAVGTVGVAGLVLAGVGTLVVLAQFSWAWVLWLLPTGVGCALFAAGIVRARLLSRVAAALFGGGLLLTAGLALRDGLAGEEAATVFPYGLIGVGVLGIGLTWLGWQLCAERPVNTGQGITPVA